ncbi:ATP-binding protein [Paucisalibacillus sp. EB02]|uniref:hybrid sensor histidine kinase/response regulator n=1 Tax=Paucisalibacillus sp. EB02 TaxID=1347087 RepID=UPI0004B72AC5|nr:ATP-binding protein [Paucisalibacillus sp. EB02]
MKKSIKTPKWIFLIIIFLILLTAIRLSWMGYLSTIHYKNPPTADHGVLDLRGWKFNDKETLQLDGEWEFFPSTLKASSEQLNKTSNRYISVPSKWNAMFESNDSFHYGTYKLRILLDKDHDYIFGLHMNQKYNNASAIYVNGQHIGESGQVATSLNNFKGSSIPYSVSLKPDRNEIELIIQASSHQSSGGIFKSIHFGTMDAIQYRTKLSEGLQLLLCGILLLHSVYAAILYFTRFKPGHGLLYFSLMLICAIISVLSSDDKLLFRWISVDYDWGVKISFLSYIGVAAFIPQIIKTLFPVKTNKFLIRAFTALCILYALFILVASPWSIILSSRVLFYVIFGFSIFLATLILRKATIHRDESIFLVLGCLSIGLNIFWTLIHNLITEQTMHYPFDLIAALLCFTAFWFKRFSRIASDAGYLTEKLQIENQRKDNFLVNTSHELRNPLHGILNVIQTLLDDKTNPLHEEHRKRLSVLENVSKRMSFMLNDLLDVTRLKEKTIPLHIERVAIQTVVAGVIDMTKLMTEGKPIDLHIEIPDSFPSVAADETRLIQILFNLIHNAVKFTDEGTITIRAAIKDEIAHIQIEDTGIGIQKDELNHIFEPYEQATVIKERSSGGVGLGLNICKQLVELHNGEITVQSTPGKGSIFTFTLPLFKGEDNFEIVTSQPIKENNEIAATTTDIWQSDNTRDVVGKLKILLVDDDPMNVTILHSILAGDGKYVVTGATNAKQAINNLQTETYDLVIADVMMPQVSGYELTRKIRESYSISELPVLLLTARARTEDILAGFQAGANDYVTKPVDSTELRARVNALTKLKISVEEHIRMEGAWLQSQIQPHFIFNTLNSIAALGEIDVTKMQQLLVEFSNYLRLSFDFHNAEPVIPLEHELSLVRSYLYIEKTRFGNRLEIEWKIETDATVLLPPLSIQPLVENAVKHGILQLNKGGKVSIQVMEQLDYIEVSVIDNGKGMTEKETSNLLSGEKENGKTSVGLRNVDSRLKQLYGNGLLIRSKIEHGTTASFQIPKNKE